MLIKAGTYRFNDVLSGQNVQIVQYIDFRITPRLSLSESGNLVISDGYNNCSYIRVNDSGGVTALLYTEADLNMEVPVYVSPYGFSTLQIEYGIDELMGWGQYITIPTDTEVSADFYVWFTANAVEQKQISGKWTFKDELSFPPYADNETHRIPVNITVSGNVDSDTLQLLKDQLVSEGYEFDFVVQDYSFVCNYSEISLYVNDNDNYFSMNYHNCIASAEPHDTVFEQLVPMILGGSEAYHSNFGWGTTYPYYQTIDFGTEPQAVSAEFYEWLTENATQPTAKITYNGSTIAILFGGQTATLKCEGMKMESDVVIETAEVKGAVLQEKTATENGEVTPDEGYDGLSKVTVAVESSGGAIEDYDGTITIE